MHHLLQIWQTFQDEYNTVKFRNIATFIFVFIITSATIGVVYMRIEWQDQIHVLILYNLLGWYVVAWTSLASYGAKIWRRNHWKKFAYLIVMLLVVGMVNCINIWKTFTAIWNSDDGKDIWRTSFNLITIFICLLTLLLLSMNYIKMIYSAYNDRMEEYIGLGYINVTGVLLPIFLFLSLNPSFWGFIIYPIGVSFFGTLWLNPDFNFSFKILETIESRFGFRIENIGLFAFIIFIVEMCFFFISKGHPGPDMIDAHMGYMFMFYLVWTGLADVAIRIVDGSLFAQNSDENTSMNACAA